MTGRFTSWSSGVAFSAAGVNSVMAIYRRFHTQNQNARCCGSPTLGKPRLWAESSVSRCGSQKRGQGKVERSLNWRSPVRETRLGTASRRLAVLIFSSCPDVLQS